ncbi:MAG: 16S rRNA (uracil(1498)-N(3))-methyltransferase [Parvularcula sp.]
MSKPPPRLYLDQPLAAQRRIALDAEQAHYLGKVLRLKPKDFVLGFNGRDGEWRLQIDVLQRADGSALCTECIREQPTASNVTLAFAPTKKGPTEFLVQKATELGVAHLQPIITERTQDRKASARWPVIAREAAEQCERLDVPTIAAPLSLDEMIAARGENFLMFADEAAVSPPGGQHGAGHEARGCLAALADAPAGCPWTIIVGPAGGFTPQERDRLLALETCIPVTLGPRILKAETAGIVALTLWQAVLGDLS